MVELQGGLAKGRGVVALVADLMFASRIRGAAASAGMEVSTAMRADDVVRRVREGHPAIVLVDLDHESESPVELVRRLKTDSELAGLPVIGFVSHVNEEAIRAARAAGADRVLARSSFVRELPTLVRGEWRPAGPGDAA